MPPSSIDLSCAHILFPPSIATINRCHVEGGRVTWQRWAGSLNCCLEENHQESFPVCTQTMIWVRNKPDCLRNWDSGVVWCGGVVTIAQLAFPDYYSASVNQSRLLLPFDSNQWNSLRIERNRKALVLIHPANFPWRDCPVVPASWNLWRNLGSVLWRSGQHDSEFSSPLSQLSS